MISVDLFAVIFAFMALCGTGFFFYLEKKAAGFAFLVAFIVALATVSQQRVILSSFFVGVTVEKARAQP